VFLGEGERLLENGESALGLAGILASTLEPLEQG
jgi:hypothetical protein